MEQLIEGGKSLLLANPSRLECLSGTAALASKGDIFEQMTALGGAAVIISTRRSRLGIARSGSSRQQVVLEAQR